MPSSRNVNKIMSLTESNGHIQFVITVEPLNIFSLNVILFFFLITHYDILSSQKVFASI